MRGDPPVEREIKLRLAGADAGRDALKRIGAEPVRPRHLEDNVLLDDVAGRMRAAGRVIRLRRTDGGGVLTYKGPSQVVDGVKSREEVEIAVADPDAFETILAAMGFSRIFRYQKYREVYRWGGVEIVVDETPVGAFLEIEGEAAEIGRAAAALGFGPADYVTDSYPALFVAAGGRGDMVFP